MNESGITLVALAPNHWDLPWRNRQHVLSRLAARGWPIIYSPGPLSWWERKSVFWRSAPIVGRFEECDNLRVFRPGRLPFRWRPATAWDRWVSGHHAGVLSRQIPIGDKMIVMLFHPALWPIAGELDSAQLVYYPFDNFRREGGWTEELAAMERTVIERAGLVVASSKAIADDLPIQALNKVRVLGNGVDFNAVVHAANQPCMAPLASIPRPRIGYCGVVNRKIDFLLVQQIALRHPDWHWVFIGPERGLDADGDEPFFRQQDALASCRTLPNVHFLGAMLHSEVFNCLHHMDVNVICNRSDSGWWQDTYPLKFHEYLAAGKPVISSPIASLEEFAGVAEIAEGVDGWVGALHRAISAGGVGTVSERRAVARQNDWERRVTVLEGWLTQLELRGYVSKEIAA